MLLAPFVEPAGIEPGLVPPATRRSIDQESTDLLSAKRLAPNWLRFVIQARGRDLGFEGVGTSHDRKPGNGPVAARPFDRGRVDTRVILARWGARGRSRGTPWRSTSS